MNKMIIGRYSEEELSPIFNGLYVVTNDGNLYSTRSGKFLSPNTDKYGYDYFVVSVDSVRYTLKAHRLVAKAFIPNTENKPTVNHKNGIRNDNRVSNLEWATHKEQQADPLTTIKRNRVVARTDYRAMGALCNFGRKRTAVYKNDALVGVYESLKEAAEQNDANVSKASECANGRRKQAGGVRFCYL